MLTADCINPQGYTSALALAWLLSRQQSRLLAAHFNSVLLVTLGVYAYRDVLPLMLRDRDPADAADGVVLWVKMFFLLDAAVVLPLLTPRVYKLYKLNVGVHTYLRLFHSLLCFTIGTHGESQQTADQLNLLPRAVQLAQRDCLQGISRRAPSPR